MEYSNLGNKGYGKIPSEGLVYDYRMHQPANWRFTFKEGETEITAVGLNMFGEHVREAGKDFRYLENWSLEPVEMPVIKIDSIKKTAEIIKP